MKRLAWLALPFSLALAACGDEGDCPGSVDGNSIDGSYCAFADLEFSAVRVEFFTSSNALNIRYGNGSGDAFSSQLVVLAQGQDLVFEEGTIPGEFLTVRAVPSGGTTPGSVDIDRESSNLVLEEWGGIGARASGEVNLLIELRGQSGAGRLVTLDGTFSGTVVDGDASFGD